MNRRTLLAIALICASQFANAIPITCAIDKRTDARQCVAPSEVRDKDGIRFAPLYTGGPNKIEKSKFFVYVNCKSEVLHLKDSAGVSFAGGNFSDRSNIRDLGGIVCEAPLKKK